MIKLSAILAILAILDKVEGTLLFLLLSEQQRFSPKFDSSPVSTMFGYF